MASQDAPRKRSGCARVMVFGIMLLLGAAAVVGLLLFTGMPQRLGAGYLLSSQLGGQADVASISLRNPLTVQGLTLAEKGASVYGPPLKVQRISVDYALAPEGGRHVSSVQVSGAQISLQQGAATNNFQFLLDRFAQPAEAGGDLTPWLPEHIGVEDLWLELNFPSYYVRMDNLAFDTALAGLSEGTLALDAQDLGVAWSSVYTPGARRSSTGTLTFDAGWGSDGVDIDVTVDLGPLAQIQGMASLLYRDGKPFYALSIPEATLEDPLWSAMLTDLSPVAVRFDKLSVTGSDVHVHQGESGYIVDQASLDATIPALAVGPGEAPYYAGPLKLAVRGNYGDVTEITGTVTLLEDTAFEGTLRRAPEGMEGSFQWAPWSREALAQLTPPNYAAALELLQPLKRLGASGTVGQGADGVNVDGELTGIFDEGDALKVPLAITYAASDAGSTLVANARMDLHGGAIESTVTVPPDAPVTVKNRLEKVQPNHWTAYLLGNELVPWFSGQISGDAGVTLPPGEPLALDLDLTGEQLRYGDIVLPEDEPVTMSGQLTYNLETATLASRNAHLAQAGFVDLTTDAWSLDLNKAVMEMAIQESTLSLDAVAAMFGLSDLYGNAAISGKLRVGPDQTRLESFSARSEDLGYGDYSVPYGLALALGGSLAYTRESNTLQLDQVNAQLGEGTNLSAGLLAFRFPGEGNPFTMQAAPFTLNTDMDVLVRRGLLGGAENGSLAVRGDDFRWDGEKYTGVVNWDIAADSLEFPEGMATLQDVSWSGRYNPGDEEDGGGPLTASAFAVYEVPFGPVDTRLRLTPEDLRWDAFETTFLGGGLVLNGRVDYNDPAFPGKVNVTADKLDLAEFTKVFEPPDVILTGKVSGTADMVLSMDGLQDLNVNLTASDGLSLNRSMVRQILMSQYVNDAVGSKSVQKVIEKVIGDDEQRPFESAVLELRLEDGLIKGVAKLTSESLDVTVDINAEPMAILEAIRSTSAG